MSRIWVTTAASGAFGAFVAAWAGAQLGFRRSRKERALDRRIEWHEGAIEALAQYEERLEALRNHALNVLVIQRTQQQQQGGVERPPADEVPRTIQAPAALWAALADTERRARAMLRLGDLYTEGRTQLACSVALNNSVNMVARHWFDISPEPEIPWVDLQSKAMAAANVRQSLQESLKLVLEIDGMLAVLLGPKYRRWRTLRRLGRLKKEIESPVS